MDVRRDERTDLERVLDDGQCAARIGPADLECDTDTG
jgi:hypothetical protein